MTYLPPYYHELEQIARPFINAIMAGHDRPTYRRFTSVLNELEDIIQSSADITNPQQAYLNAANECQANPRHIKDRTIANGIAAATIGTTTDILGIIYEEINQSAEDDLNQYFTPPNVCDALAVTGITAREEFDPPAPDMDNVQGKTTLSLFATDDDSDDSVADSPDQSSLTIFDPACGSGRLLLAGARQSKQDYTVLGWEIERKTAHMAAITLGLLDIPGWIVGGDALNLETREIYRIAPESDDTLQSFTDFRQADVPDITANPSFNTESYCPFTSNNNPTAEDVIHEINTALDHGVDHVISNPPYAKRSLEDSSPAPNRSHEDYETFHSTTDDPTSPLRSTQDCEWLFIELALTYTKQDGAVSMIVPTSILAAPTHKSLRNWLLDVAYYESTFELPPETFAPATTTGTSMINITPKDDQYRGVTPDYEIFMATIEAVGHDEQRQRAELEPDNHSPSVAASDLPVYYQAHTWSGLCPIPIPDDDLPTAVREHHAKRTNRE